jgi:hypothetical protein
MLVGEPWPWALGRRGQTMIEAIEIRKNEVRGMPANCFRSLLIVPLRITENDNIL